MESQAHEMTIQQAFRIIGDAYATPFGERDFQQHKLTKLGICNALNFLCARCDSTFADFCFALDVVSICSSDVCGGEYGEYIAPTRVYFSLHGSSERLRRANDDYRATCSYLLACLTNRELAELLGEADDEERT